jgi:pimeloyl-ACP methyl ester carboxylesterase
MRGRGDSGYAKESATYNPLQYVDDVEVLLAELGLTRIVAVGTSLGGLMTAILAIKHPGLLAGAVLNDIGPVIEPEGLARIRGYVGQGRSFPTWMHAARALEETQGVAFPNFAMADWLAMAKRVMTMGQNGRVVFDYDMKIAEPFEQRGGETPAPDMWPAFAALGPVPLLSLRGDLSDILSAATHAEMQQRLQGDFVTLAGVGHAPTLDEPESRAAIDRLLARVS